MTSSLWNKIQPFRTIQCFILSIDFCQIDKVAMSIKSPAMNCKHQIGYGSHLDIATVVVECIVQWRKWLPLENFRENVG